MGYFSSGTEGMDRTPEQQAKYDKEKELWRIARERLPNLKAVIDEIEQCHSPIDGHDMFMLVKHDPEMAAIALTQMFEALQAIQIGQAQLAELARMAESVNQPGGR